MSDLAVRDTDEPIVMTSHLIAALQADLERFGDRPVKVAPMCNSCVHPIEGLAEVSGQLWVVSSRDD